MILLLISAILLATIEFNKQLIDNVKPDAKQQKQWHYAQFVFTQSKKEFYYYLTGQS